MLTDPVAPAVVALNSKSSAIAGSKSGMVLLPKVCDTTPAKVTRITLPQRISLVGSTANIVEWLVDRVESPELGAGSILRVTKSPPLNATPGGCCSSHHPTIVIAPVYSYDCHKCF